MRLTVLGVFVLAACGDSHHATDAPPADARPADAQPDALACTGTQTMCGDACVDLTSDPANCGACGHACGCGSTTCTTGVCDSHALATAQGAPVVLALHADRLYWGNDVDRTLSTVDLVGGAASVLYPGRTAIRGFAFDATRIYFSRAVFNIMESGALDGSNSGNFTNQQESGANGVAADDTTVYWVTGNTGNVRSHPLGGVNSGPGTTLATGQNGADALAVDATNVYWTTNIAAGGSILTMPKAGGTPTTLASNQPSAHGIAVTATHVYWSCAGNGTPNTGSVRRVPIGGGAVETLADNQPGPYLIALDATYIYWTDIAAGAVMRMPLAGGAPSAVAIHEQAPAGLVVTPTCLYFADYADGTAGTGSVRSHDLQ